MTEVVATTMRLVSSSVHCAVNCGQNKARVEGFKLVQDIPSRNIKFWRNFTISL